MRQITENDTSRPRRDDPGMFVPKAFRPVSQQSMVELVRASPLATLVTSSGSGKLFATHLPVILVPDALTATGSADVDDLVGTVLFGHMNRLNPHYEMLGALTTSLVIISGPHGYVSPAVYETTPAAPTWDFTAVHIRGEISVVREAEETRHIVRSTARLLESRFGQGWDSGPSLEYFDRILPGVGAFRMNITVADGMFKLSQDQPAEVRAKVAASFAADDRHSHGGLAELMKRSMGPVPQG